MSDGGDTGPGGGGLLPGSTQEVCASLPGFPKGEIEAKMEGKAF